MSQAYDHYSSAVMLVTKALDLPGDSQEVINLTGLADVLLGLAHFAVNHPALVAGIDENTDPRLAQQTPATPAAGPGGVWGA